MDYAYKGAEASKTRSLDLLLADKKYSDTQLARDDQEEQAMWTVFTKMIGI